jgi:hypothetical protein
MAAKLTRLTYKIVAIPETFGCIFVYVYILSPKCKENSKLTDYNKTSENLAMFKYLETTVTKIAFLAKCFYICV